MLRRFAFLAIVLLATSLHASDVWVLSGMVGGGCYQLTWLVDTLWAPANGASPFYLHLDVPDSVVVQNVLNVGIQSCLLNPAPYDFSQYGLAQLPTFRALRSTA